MTLGRPRPLLSDRLAAAICAMALVAAVLVLAGCRASMERLYGEPAYYRGSDVNPDGFGGFEVEEFSSGQK